MTNQVAKTSTQNIVPVQAEFDVNGVCLGLVGPGGQFFSPPISTDTITNSTITSSTITSSTIDSTSIGATTPSTGAFTSLSSTSDATIHGLTVGQGGGSGTGNTALGVSALTANTASNNTAVGYLAGYSNTTGTVNAFGFSALYKNTTATQNSAFGQQSLYNTTTGDQNNAFGLQTLYSNTTGSSNSGYGTYSLFANTTGSYTLWQHETGVDQTYLNQITAIESYFETNVLGVGAGTVGAAPAGDNLWTRCERIEPDFIQSGTMDVIITGKGYADDTDNPSSPYFFNPDTLKIDMKEQRREMRLRFHSNVQSGDYFLGRVMLSLETGDVRGTGSP